MLLLVVGTLVGVAIPMLMAIISIVVALGITAVVGQAFELNLFILNMIVAMGLALGIDYSLFIVSRLREERHRGSDTREAILTVANTATRAVVFSGTAFALAMIAMLLVPDTTLRSLGLGAVIVGVVSIVVALTFHPAMLMVLGDRVDRLRVPWLGRRIAASAGEEGPLWRRAVLAVMRRPAISLIATTAVLLALAFPVLGLQLGAAGTSSLPDDTVAKQGLLALRARLPQRRDRPGHRRRRRLARRPGRPAGTRAPARRARGRSGLRRPRADGRDRPARRRGLRAAHRRAEQRTRRPPRSTACATTTCRPPSARQPIACSSAARRPRRTTRSRSTGAGCRS